MTSRDTSRILVEEALTRRVIGAFFRVYDVLGYGFLESDYRRALAIEVRRRGMRVEEEWPIEVRYLGEVVGVFRADLLVESRLTIELKATASVGEVDRAQLFNYLRGSRLVVGLLLHFGPKPRVQRAVAEAYSVDADTSGTSDNGRP
jgi:GxxExxY protein